MIIEFRLKNYLSFKEEQVFSMVADHHLEKIKENMIEIEQDELYVLKSASIFGANASGKSNLLSAINFMKVFIINCVKESQDSDELRDMSFALDEDSKNKDTEFELVFLYKDIFYRYGFTLGRKVVSSEWLYIDEVCIFRREKDKIIDFHLEYIGEDEKELKFSMTNDKSLFLTILSSTNTPFAEEILTYFRENIHVISGVNTNNLLFTKKMMEKEDDKSKMVSMLKDIDTSIRNVHLETRRFRIESEKNHPIPKSLLDFIKSDNKKLLSTHSIYNNKGQIVGEYNFDMEIFESDGTKRFLQLSSLFIDTLENGNVLLIDEIDVHLHPLILEYILELFHSKSNSKHAQLIMTTHNMKILDNELQRRDQIWFTEKDCVEASNLTSLVNYREDGKVIKETEEYDKSYLQGRYGAVPFISKNIIDYFMKEGNDES